MRVAIYARYSSDNQRDASIEDQIRICRARIQQEGWTLAATFTDHAMSGATTLRPGYQKLLEEARANRFDVVLTEALDRVSRDQEDIAGFYKQMSFAGIRLVTLSEGDISELHVGLKGTMNALFLKDLAQKTWRGLEGRVRAGRSGGGLCYGYEIERHDERGRRLINPTEAAVVERIFRQYANGASPRSIAKALNAESIAGPRAGTWNASTIHGNWRRGTGILNNELYVGRLVWNRQRFVKDPSTGRRQARMNPSDKWVVEQVPDLRIIADDLWAAAKRRQQHGQSAVEASETGYRLNGTHRRRYLFSGLIKCGACGGGYTIVARDRYGCANHRNRGTCDNGSTLGREHLEHRVLDGLKTRLMAPELVEEFTREYHAELNRMNAGREAAYTASREELAQIDRKIRAIMSVIEDGLVTESTKTRLLELEGRKRALSEMPAPAPVARLHPSLANLYRDKVENLHAALDREETRVEAGAILRTLIDEIKVTPVLEGDVQVELFGELAAMLSLGQNKKTALSGYVPESAVSLVAGTRNQRYLRLAETWCGEPVRRLIEDKMPIL